MSSEKFSFKKFSANSFYSEQNDRLVEMVGLGSGQRIMDLACGTGGVTRIILDRLAGARDSVVVGIDHSAIALKQAMEDLKDARDSAVQFVQSQVEQCSDAVKESMDAVIFCNAIHYVPNKAGLLNEIARTLKPGGKLAFNTTFFEGAHPVDTFGFYRKWMLKTIRHLRREYDISPSRSEKVMARKQLTPSEYEQLVEGQGFRISEKRIDTVKFTLAGFIDISTFEDFIQGTMPGVPLDKASNSLKVGAEEAFEEMKVDFIPRNWLDVIAVRI